MQEYLIIGQIVKPQGVKGELKVKVLSEDINRFDDVENVYIKNDQHYELLSIIEAKTRGEFAYIKINNVNDMNTAEKYRNMFLYVDRENAIELEPDRYFICDLEGVTVYTDSGKNIGILNEILQTGSADVYCVVGEKKIMFPALKKLILEVDLHDRKIIISEQILDEVAVYED